MNLKEFFKPTKRKIVAFVITLILVLIYVFFAFPCPVYLGGGLFGSSICGVLPLEGLMIFGWPTILAWGFLSQLGTATANIEYMIYIQRFFRIFIFILGPILNLFYLYTISTLVLKLVEKVKKK